MMKEVDGFAGQGQANDLSLPTEGDSPFAPWPAFSFQPSSFRRQAAKTGQAYSDETNCQACNIRAFPVYQNAAFQSAGTGPSNGVGPSFSLCALDGEAGFPIGLIEKASFE